MPSDEALARGVQNGNAGDLIVLVDRHHGPLFGFLYRMTGGHRTLAEDLVQETFLRLLASIARYNYPRPFKPWLYAIALNLVRDFYKRAETRRARSVPDESLAEMPGGPPPEERLLEHEEVLALSGALATMPEIHREVIVLRYYQELSLAEIAEVLDVPLGTVKSRLYVALRRLKEQLEATTCHA